MNVIVDHLKELIELTQISPTEYRPTPKENLAPKEIHSFWRYHGHFANDFAKAVSELVPPETKFVQYDHLLNVITVEVL